MKTKLRILSLLTALMMMLGVTSVLAEAPKAPTLEDILNNSGNVQMEAQITIDPQAAMMIMAMTGMEADEATTSQFTALIEAVNKLKASFIGSKTGFSGALGTEHGNLLDFQTSMNDETYENQTTSNLFPGLALTFDPAFLKESFAQASLAQQMTPEQAEQMVAPYLAAISSWSEKFASQVTTEEGTFEIENYGTFTSKTPFVLTSYMMADLLQALADVLKDDQGLKNYIQQSMEAAQGTMGGADENVDLARDLVQLVSDIRSGDDMPVLVGNYYKNDNLSYMDLQAAPDIPDEAFKLDWVFNNEGENFQLSGRFIQKSLLPQTEEETAIDWADVEKQIKAGQNYTDTLVTLAINSTLTQPTLTGDFTLNLFNSGMNLGLQISSTSRMDKLEGSSALKLFFMSPEPLVTISFTTAQTEEAPKAPQLEGTQALTISEDDLSEEDDQLLEASLQKALLDLMQNLNTVLPEEGPALLKMIQDAMSGGQPEPSAP